jgi:hypothetical protein
MKTQHYSVMTTGLTGCCSMRNATKPAWAVGPLRDREHWPARAADAATESAGAAGAAAGPPGGKAGPGAL